MAGLVEVIAAILRFLSGGILSRALDTIDRRIEADTDKEALKAEVIKAHYASRGDWMRSGGFWLSLIFALPLGFWYGAVCVYSVFWCAGCAYPQEWTIAALPAPLDEWAGMIVVSIFGVVGISKLRR